MSPKSYQHYQNIIFDLGGVVINLDTDRTLSSFSDLSGLSLEQVRDYFHHEAVFTDYETGKISDADFREGLRDLLGKPVSDEQVDAAWNAMLLDIPKARIDLLRSLQGNHRLFVLSNTNAIHIRAFNRILNEAHGYENLGPLFEKIYYSHEVGLRKPNIAIFEHVISDNRLVPGQTLFLDDNAMNVAAAGQAGLDTLHVTSGAVVEDYFKR